MAPIEAAARRSPRTWLFDLDGTLHDVAPEIMPRINRDMTAFVARSLSISIEEANAIRTGFWHRYGSTLAGMVRHHGTDPHEFLHACHQFPDMDRLVRPDRRLQALLRCLPGRHLVLTNAPRAYACAVLARLGVLRQFEAVISIEDMRFAGHWRPKPSISMLRCLAARHRFDPRRAVLVEDTPANLAGARACGLSTVLIRGFNRSIRGDGRRRAGRARAVDFQIQSVLTLTRIALR